MIHQPMGGFQGQAADIAIHAKEVLRLREEINGILAKHTGQSVKTIHEDTDRDNIMTADEALDYGLVDRVIVGRISADESDEPDDDSAGGAPAAEPEPAKE